MDRRALDLLGRLLGEQGDAWRDEWSRLDRGLWPKLLWIWERPRVQQIRITLTVANFSVRLPALFAIVLTQGSLLWSQVGREGRGERDGCLHPSHLRLTSRAAPQPSLGLPADARALPHRCHHQHPAHRRERTDHLPKDRAHGKPM